MTSNNTHSTLKRHEHVASSNRQSVGSVDASLLKRKHVSSSDDEGSLKHHERVENQVTSCDGQSTGESSGKLSLPLKSET